MTPQSDGKKKSKSITPSDAASTTPRDANEWERVKKRKSFFNPFGFGSKVKQPLKTPVDKTIVEKSRPETSQARSEKPTVNLEVLKSAIKQEVEATCNKHLAKMEQQFGESRVRMEEVFRDSFDKMEESFRKTTAEIKSGIDSTTTLSAQTMWSGVVAFIEELTSQMTAIPIPQQAGDPDDGETGPHNSSYPSA